MCVCVCVKCGSGELLEVSDGATSENRSRTRVLCADVPVGERIVAPRLGDGRN